MEDEPQAEHIANGLVLGLHVLDVDDLRSHVARSAAPHEEVLRDIGELSQPEVGNHALEAALTLEQDVLRLKVAVHDLLGVHFLQAAEDGVDGGLDLQGLEAVLGLDLIVQLPSFEQLHHDVQRILGLEDLEEPHAVLMAEVPHDLYFLDEALLSLVLRVRCLF